MRQREQRREFEAREQQVRTEKKRLIAEWKQQRAEEEERQAARRRREEFEHARMEEEKRLKQLRQREVVEMYRQNKAAEEAREKELARPTSASRRSMSCEDKRRMQQRNADLFRKKVQL